MSDAPETKGAEDIDAPGAVIHLPTGPQWVHETPEQIKERIGAARLGTDDQEDGMLHLVGLDLFPGGDVEPFELAVDPRFVLLYRGVTDRLWKAHTETAREAQQQPGPPPPEIPGFKVVSGGNLGEVLAEALGMTREEPPPAQKQQHDEERAPGQPMLSVKAQEQFNAECCCGHPAREHDNTTEFVGPCSVEGCGCSLFHQHK